MTAMPWGQKKRRSEMIQSQTVTPPLAAIEGTTFRLKTATTKRSTRSRRPRARIKWGGAADSAVVDKVFPISKQTDTCDSCAAKNAARFAQVLRRQKLALPG